MSNSVVPFKKLKVLIGDEHDFIRKSLYKALSNLGCLDIIECHRGREIKSSIENLPIDFFIMELFFQDVDGFELIRKIRLREFQPDIPIIIVTGETSRDDIIKAIDFGATDYIIKPFQAEQIENKILTVLTSYYSPPPEKQVLRTVEELVHSGKFKEAESVLTLSKVPLPEAPRMHLQAQILLKTNRTSEGIKLLKEIISTHPSFLKSYRSLSDIFLDQNQIQLAINALEKELELNPKQHTRQVKLANLLMKTGDLEGASEHFRQALLDHKLSREALYGMGVIYGKSQNLDKCLYYFKRLRRAYPDDRKSLDAIVKICKALNKPNTAELILRDEKKTHPHRLDAYLVLSEFYKSVDRQEEATAVLEECVKKNPRNILSYEYLAEDQLLSSTPSNSMETFKKYVDITGDTTAHIREAEIFMNNNKFGFAISAVHSALSGQSSNVPQALKLLLTSTFKTKQLAKAYFIQMRLTSITTNKLDGAADSLTKHVQKRREGKRIPSSPTAS